MGRVEKRVYTWIWDIYAEEKRRRGGWNIYMYNSYLSIYLSIYLDRTEQATPQDRDEDGD
jgi:hypothetical protein